MTAMKKPSESISDSEYFDTPPHGKSNTNHLLKHSNNTKYKSDIKFKIVQRHHAKIFTKKVSFYQ